MGEETTSVLEDVPEIAWKNAIDFGATEWSPRWNREVAEVARKICDIESSFRSNFALLAELAPGIADVSDVDRWRLVANLADATSEIKCPTPRGLYTSAWETTEAKIRRWIELSGRREEAQGRLEKIDARRLAAFCSAPLAERTAERGGLRWGTLEFNSCEADAWGGCSSNDETCCANVASS